jgi:hypothetical protein
MLNARAVVSGVLDDPLTLTLYDDAGEMAAVELTPIRAIILAGELIDRAAMRLGADGAPLLHALAELTEDL